MSSHTCLFCNAPLEHIFADLGTCPPSNAFLRPDQLDSPELFHPLQAWVCSNCLLVQGPHFKRPQEIFTHDYVYYSSFSRSWVEHAKQYVDSVIERFGLNENSLVVEVGSNDGYLLQHVLKRGIPCVGIDPCSGAAAEAQIKGIQTVTNFFNTSLAKKFTEQDKQADLLCGINVFAHVPDINDFVSAIQMMLKPTGIMTMEFPHLLHLVRETQFDTIYHEHYFYYTLNVVKNILETHGLRVFDVQELKTHGGSLRVFACNENASHTESSEVSRVLSNESKCGMNRLDFYLDFQSNIENVKNSFLSFLIDAKRSGKKVAGYGAAAKGNTLLNYCGVKRDLLPFVVDASPHKQGKYLPGSRIPVLAEEMIKLEKPDYILILPWNLKEEISEQLNYARSWNAKFVIAIPELEIW